MDDGRTQRLLGSPVCGIERGMSQYLLKSEAAAFHCA
jgi:hypothetical protein